MNFKNISAVLFLILIILSCNNSDTKEETQKKEGKFENLKDNSLSSIDSPCELISIDEIRTICNVGSEIEITQEEKNRTKSTCEFEWKDKKVNKVIMAGG
ncbi:MAG TPA: hypothetical protein EYG85_09880, partial [Crocinitomix sp.]|nr:hypothetical protein [Crocinitomix sp.]